MDNEEKYIQDMMKYYNQTLAFLHEEEKDEWMFLLKDVLRILGKIMKYDYDVRYIISAMYYILTTNKEYSEHEQETFYRHMRVWSKIDEVNYLAFRMVDLLMDEEDEEIDEEALNQLLDVFEASNIKGIIKYDREFDAEELFRLQENKDADPYKIKYIENLFFEGNLNTHENALDIAYTILQVEPFAYHILIFVMDLVVKDGITGKSIAFLEAFTHTFEIVEHEWIKKEPRDLESPSDLREYCFGLSSIAMFYLEEENFEKAIQYYEKLLIIDVDNVFHSKEYILRAYMFNNQFDKYSDILDSLPEQSVYKRLLVLYRKIQLYEDDVEEYLEDTIKHYGYLLNILVKPDEIDTSKLPEIEEDFLIEYGSLFEEDKQVIAFIQEFLKKYNFTA